MRAPRFSTAWFCGTACCNGCCRGPHGEPELTNSILSQLRTTWNRISALTFSRRAGRSHIEGAIMTGMTRSVANALAAFAFLSCMLVMAVPAAHADDKEIAQPLRAGHLLIVVPHRATFPHHADTD